MTKDELKQMIEDYIKQNLEIRITNNGHQYVVMLTLDGEIISQDEVYTENGYNKAYD